jgi:glycosyltransferase involved in cell wall biosynthesis
MRILVDTSIMRRPATGIARWVEGLVSSLSTGGEEVIAAPGPTRLGRGTRLYRIPNTLRQRWWYDVALPRLATRCRSDVLLSPSNYAARRSWVPQVVTLHDVNFLAAPETYERAMEAYLARVFRHAIANADVITTVSKHSRHELAARFDVDPMRISVVYPGLDPPPPGARPPSPHGTRPYALYVGATERHKNVGALLHAWAPESPGGLDLVIVGQPGRAHVSVTEQAATMLPRVIVRGSVDQPELERWYANASVFVFPSMAEGFGYPPLEAMLRGVPVVASRAGSLPEVLGDAALYHEPSDAREIGRLVSSVATDTALRQGLIERGRSRAALYTWDRAASGMRTVLRSAIDIRA